MPESSGTLRRLRDEYGRKAVKYAGVSVLNVIIGQGLLFFCSKILGLDYVPANVLAVVVSSGPAFILSRRYVWQKKGDNRFWQEIVPFWAMALAGLVLSTIAASVASNYSDATIVLMAVNLGAFGVLWVGKFFVLDKLLFADKHPITDTAEDALVDELLHPEAFEG